MSFVPRLSPCKSIEHGADDWSRYEELGLPREWIDMRPATNGRTTLRASGQVPQAGRAADQGLTDLPAAKQV